MPAKLTNTLWLTLLIASAALMGGWLAENLITLEKQNKNNWHKELKLAAKEKNIQIVQWLTSKSLTAQEIGNDPRIKNMLRHDFTQSNLNGDILPNIDASETLYDIAKLRYGLTHSYIFNMDGRMVLKQDGARDLPLKIRKTLAQAFNTNLDHYMFVSFFANKKWFFSSARIKYKDDSLGYAMFMTEVGPAVSDIAETASRWRFIDSYLARRSGNDSTFLIDFQNRDALLFKLDRLNIPLFRGVSNSFGIYKFPDGIPYMVLTTGLPGYPFWQSITSVPLEVATLSIRKAQIYYFIGGGVFLLALLLIAVVLTRRIIVPSRPALPLLIRKPFGYIPNEKIINFFRQFFEKPILSFSTDKRTAPRQDVTPRNLFKTIQHVFRSRKLTEEERDRLRRTQEKTKESLHTRPATPNLNLNKSSVENREIEALQPQPADPKKTHENLTQGIDAKEHAQIKQILHCLENERYRLFFQPILATSSKNKVMFETLLRLVNDNGELMQPAEFIPLAIKYKFIDQIDDMVIMASLRRHMEILTQGKDTMLSINLSYGAFSSENFHTTYQEGLASGKIKPDRLNFELSSKEIIEDAAAMDFVRNMQASGCKFSVDYFGNIQFIKAAKKMKFDYMKVNCLHFDGLDKGNPKAIKEFRDVILVAQQEDLAIIAEKVENETVLTLCKKAKHPPMFKDSI